MPPQDPSIGAFSYCIGDTSLPKIKHELTGLQREDHPCERGCVYLTVEPRSGIASGPMRQQRSSNDNQ